MPLTEQTRQIVKLAWARLLHLEDLDLDSGDPAVRVEVVDDDSAAATFVRLFDRTVIFGPSEVVGDARSLPDSQLAQERCLLDLVRAHHQGARALGAAHLLYCEESPQLNPLDDVAVAFEPELISTLMAAAPADDVAVSGLADAQWAAALVMDAPGAEGSRAEEVVAAAGREVWQHLIAQLGLLTHPEHRGRGYGGLIAGVAVEEALADGLIPQWRSALENEASRRAALRLGFTDAGSQTTVVLD